MKQIQFVILSLLLIFTAGCGGSSVPPEDGTPSQPAAYIENKGSDTMVNLALAWAERYQAQHSEVRISVTGGGSGTGIAALINRTVDLANASRAIKAEEQQAAEMNGAVPIEFVVARDAIAVIVNLNNPIDNLTIEQVGDIYSGKISNWSELGGDDRPIVRLSRETNSGTHIYFLEEVLRLGDSENKTFFSTNTLLLPSSEGITSEVRDNPNAIGYDGLGYVTHEVKVLAVAAQGSDQYIYPSAESVNNGEYPISRDLYVYTVGEPAGAVKAYLEWILSPEAQEIVVDLGFVPIKDE